MIGHEDLALGGVVGEGAWDLDPTLTVATTASVASEMTETVELPLLATKTSPLAGS